MVVMYFNFRYKIIDNMLLIKYVIKQVIYIDLYMTY